VFVAAPEDDNWAIEALTAGARGILGKRAAPDDLHKALRAVIDGEIWSSRRVLTTWLARLTSPCQPAPAAAVSWDLHTLLSDREREVFRHAATGMGNKEVAAALSISEATISVFWARSMAITGCVARHTSGANRALCSRLLHRPSAVMSGPSSHHLERHAHDAGDGYDRAAQRQ